MERPVQIVRARTASRHSGRVGESARTNAEHTPAAAVRDQVKESVASLPDVANTFAKLMEIALLLHDHAVFQHEANERRRREPADEDVSLPTRECITCIEHHSRGRDDRVPIVYRLLHARL